MSALPPLLPYLTVSDGLAVDSGAWHYAERRGSEERFICVCHLIKSKIFFGRGNRHLFEQFQSSGTGDPQQDVPARRRVNPSVTNNEEVGPAALGNETVVVGEQRPSLGIDGLRL